MPVMADYVRKMTAKKSYKYGEYGSFEHVLFLFNGLISFRLGIMIESVEIYT